METPNLFYLPAHPAHLLWYCKHNVNLAFLLNEYLYYHHCVPNVAENTEGLSVHIHWKVKIDFRG